MVTRQNQHGESDGILAGVVQFMEEAEVALHWALRLDNLFEVALLLALLRRLLLETTGYLAVRLVLLLSIISHQGTLLVLEDPASLADLLSLHAVNNPTIVC